MKNIKTISLIIVLALFAGNQSFANSPATIIYKENKKVIKSDTLPLSENVSSDCCFDEYWSANQLENWMFDEFCQSDEYDVIEDWMLEDDYYDENVNIEDWMLDPDYLDNKR